MKVDLDPKFSTGYAVLNGAEVEIGEDGKVIIEIDCHRDYIAVTIEELEEVVRQAKMFRDRRTAYKGRKDEHSRKA